MDLKNIRAEAWVTHAKTSVVIDSDTTVTGKLVVAECYSEEHATLFAAAYELLIAAICEDALNKPTQEGLAILEQYGWSPENRFDCPAITFVAKLRRAAIAKATGKAA